jgi:hypothetical protein
MNTFGVQNTKKPSPVSVLSKHKFVNIKTAVHTADELQCLMLCICFSLNAPTDFGFFIFLNSHKSQLCVGKIFSH